jgi:integrative and conjugative element protein (TIGR02256 family)
MRIVLSERAYSSILTETYEKIKTETGGVFLGCFENDTFYVVEAMDPGPKSSFSAVTFEYDREYTQHLINKIARLYSHKLILVGLWHRHPGSLDTFSSTDDGTNRKYSKLNSYGAVSMIINIDPVFRMTAYQVTNPFGYKKIPYEIGDMLIPENIRRRKNAEELLGKINDYTMGLSNANKKPVSQARLDNLMDSIKEHFTPHEFGTAVNDTDNDNDVENEAEATNTYELMTELMLDDFIFLVDDMGIAIAKEKTNNPNNIVLKQADGTVEISFLYDEFKKQIIFTYDNKWYLYEKGLFSRLLSDKKSKEDDNENSRPLNGGVLRLLGFK